MNAQLQVAPRRELLIGCGARRDKEVHWEAGPGLDPMSEKWDGLVTLDIVKRHGPDVVHDLEVFPYPFPDNYFDEIHAYEVLEHVGTQGDWRFFFQQFNELWRILKPDGFLVGSCPSWHGKWAWGDPGHTRIISHASLSFLSQQFYAEQIGITSATDYRDAYHGDFRLLDLKERGPNGEQFFFALQAVK